MHNRNRSFCSFQHSLFLHPIQSLNYPLQSTNEPIFSNQLLSQSQNELSSNAVSKIRGWNWRIQALSTVNSKYVQHIFFLHLVRFNPTR
ncbi:hypothetical protein VIGAN_11061200 [Vigna angularis var. angularis]|uniref:Uncharacterized protein n=1 Tax=Vigna angularis var. angularis TaxID=157739 RepID=A0A0S3T9A3_PHAAN|nr:hypothetical protein VIGAN_11061200 [Vigna angularis var. angularis]